MKTRFRFLAAILCALFFSSAAQAETCEVVSTTCADLGKKPLGIGGAMIGPTDAGYPIDCWDTRNVYLCIGDWQSTCPNEGFFLTAAGGNYTLVPPTRHHEKVFDHPYGTNPTIGYTTVFAKFLRYDVDCPGSPYIDSNCGTAANESSLCNLEAASGLQCKAQAPYKNGSNPWSVTNSSKTHSESYTPGYANEAPAMAPLAFSFDFTSTQSQELKSKWICTTSISNTCPAADISECESLGTECTPGTYDPNLPHIPELGQCRSGTDYRVCHTRKSTTCDSEATSCGSAFASNPIYHPVYTGSVIGTQSQYTCFANSPDVACDRAGGYSTCQFSYFTCNVDDPTLAPQQISFDGRNYGTCTNWTDHFVCPSEIVVSCDGEMESCGDPTRIEELTDQGNSIYYYVDEYICYNGHISDTCGESASHDFYGCTKLGFTCLEHDPANHTNPDPVYGDCVKWVDEWACPNDATYVCDSELQDCRSPVIRPGYPEYSDNGSNSFEPTMEIGRVDDYACWTGDVNQVCDIENNIDHNQCNHSGYSCHQSDPEKAQPNIFEGRDYGQCIAWTDNWVCDLHVESTCSSEYTDCGPVDYLDGTTGAVGIEGEEDTIIRNPDDVWIDWTENYICYTGDYIEDCDTATNVEDIRECVKTGFTCLVDDPVNKEADPYYGTCAKWIDRYVCGEDQYVECNTPFEMCHSYELTEQEFHEDGQEVFRREVEYCYTNQINVSQCALEEDRCYLYDTEESCSFQVAQRDANVDICVSEGGSLAECESTYPSPSCKTEVQCPTGQRFGVDCQLDWDEHDAGMTECLAVEGNTVGHCNTIVPLPECAPEDQTYIDCPHSGFTCHEWDFNLSADDANSNEYEGRNYGYCVDWSDRYTCPQFQAQDCTASINQNECGPLGYVSIDTVQDGQAVEYTTVLECVDGEAPDCVVDPQCTLVDTGCSESNGGLCRQESMVFSCLTNRTDCVEWSLECAASDPMSFRDTDESPGNLADFVAQASIAKMVQENSKFDEGEIRIFGGLSRNCKVSEKTTIQAMIVAAFSAAVYTGYVEPTATYWALMLGIVGMADLDCCQYDEKPMEAGMNDAEDCGDAGCGGGYPDSILGMILCTDDESELAKARSARYVKDMGSYCAESLFGLCIVKKYGFCEFDNLFARIVQEQGRQQIADALASGSVASSVQETVAFPYFVAHASQGWRLGTVNGNKVAFWAWSEDCLNAQLQYNPPEGVTDYIPPICPYADEVHIASCEGAGCFVLPTTPYVPGSTDYYQNSVHAFSNQSLALNKKVYLSGGCIEGGDCSYTVNAYPDTGGATTTVAYDISWTTNATSPGWSNFEFDVGGVKIIPYETSGGTSSSSTVLLSIDEVEYTIPKDTLGVEYEVAGLNFIGSCSDQFFSCSFRVYKSLMVELLPWGSAKEPNCRGFSAEEIEALDFGAMDLSEWIATIIPDEVVEEDVLDESVDSVEAQSEALEGGARASNGKVKAVYWDNLIHHPFDDVTFRAVGRVEINADVQESFYRVTINWGDGTAGEDLVFNGTGYELTRVGGYQRTSGPAGYKVRFAFFAESGRVYESEVKIIVGLGADTKKVEHTLGGGIITLSQFAVNANSVSSIEAATGG